MKRRWTRQAEPSVEPLTVDEVRSHIRDYDTVDNAQLTGFIESARHYIESFLGRQLITATYKLYLDAFPSEIELPMPPLQSVTSIQYIDTEGAEQTLAASVYQYDTDSQPGRIKLDYAQSWPSTRGGDYDTVTVTFVAGYGDAATDVPPSILQAMRLLVASYAEMREEIVVGAGVNVVPTNNVDALLWQNRMVPV